VLSVETTEAVSYWLLSQESANKTSSKDVTILKKSLYLTTYNRCKGGAIRSRDTVSGLAWWDNWSGSKLGEKQQKQKEIADRNLVIKPK
jgi:hypothetical protein